MLDRQAYVDTLMLACSSTVGWKEDPRGSNDSPFLKAWRADVGVRDPCPWCVVGSFQMFKLTSDMHDVPNPHPKTPGSQRLWEMIPDHCKRVTPIVGALACFAHLNDGGHRDGKGHVAIVRQNLPDKHCRTWEANTDDGMSRDGYIIAEHTWPWDNGGRTVIRGRLLLLGFADIISLLEPGLPSDASNR